MNGIRAGSDNTSSVTLTKGNIVPFREQAKTEGAKAVVAPRRHVVKHGDRARASARRKVRGPHKVRGSFLTV
jgi:hypothetical protein